MGLILGLVITILFAYLGSVPVILFRKWKKRNLSWAEKICFFFLGVIIYMILGFLINPNHPSHPPVIGGAIIYFFVMIDYEIKNDTQNTKEEDK